MPAWAIAVSVVMFAVAGIVYVLTPTGPPATWKTVAHWSGAGTKDTESFAVASHEWRVAWEAKPQPQTSPGIFQIYVYNERGVPVAVAANNNGTGKDMSYVRGAGRFSLKINSGNLDWSVTVEDQR
jgi:hypothetical protein